MQQRQADVAIIGAGVVGSAIARELARYELDVVLIEKESDVGEGTSKGNSAIIHTGFDAPTGSLEARLVTKANGMFDQITRDLDVPFERVGALMVAVDEEQLGLLHKYYEKGQANGVTDVRLISRDELRGLEPNVSAQALGALSIPRESIIDPFVYVAALAENACANGVKLLLDTRVERVVLENGRVRGLETNQGFVPARFVINAAGLHTDDISETAGVRHFSITPRKGEFHVLDPQVRGLVNHIILPVPTPISKGILVAPTTDGNLIMGPTADNMKDKADKATSADGLARVVSGAQRLVPGVSERQAITQYAGLRAAGDAPDYVIQPYDAAKGFINAANIRSTGLTSSPAVAQQIAEVLRGEGLELKPKAGFNPRRHGIPRFRDLPAAEQERLVAANPQYANVICRCETVTEAEIVAAINRPAGARTLDGVKRRTRSGMGRCQGGYCSPRVIAILARELGISPLAVTKRGPGSQILACPAKSLLGKEAVADEN